MKKTFLCLSFAATSFAASLNVIDSIPPENDSIIPFGEVVLGLQRDEKITLTNVSTSSELVISNIFFGGDYSENFDDSTAQNWLPKNPDNWNVENQQYHAETDLPGVRLQSLFMDNEWQDVEAELTIKRNGYAGNIVALILRASPDFDWAEGTGNAYALGISGNQLFCVVKIVDGSITFVSYWSHCSWLYPNSQSNKIKFKIIGDDLYVYINDTHISTLTDSSVQDFGRVGVMAYSGSSDEKLTDYFFDNFTIKTPANSSITDNGHFLLDEKLTNFPFSIPANEARSFSVSYKPQNIESNNINLIIESSDSNKTVNLSGGGREDYLSVTPPETFSIRGHLGGPFLPNSKSYFVSNNWSSTIGWTALVSETWLEIDVAGGELNPGSSFEVVASINSAADTLPVGFSLSEIIFSNIFTGKTQSRTVVLEAYTTPIIEPSPASFWITNIVGKTFNEKLNIGNNATADGDLSISIFTREISREIPEETIEKKSENIDCAPQNFIKKIRKIPNNAEYRPNELLVRFVNKRTKTLQTSSENSVLKILDNALIEKSFKSVPNLSLIKLSGKKSVEDALDSLKNNPDILYASPNFIRRAYETIPNDEFFNDVWGMKNTGQTLGTPGADINVTKLWDVKTGSDDIIVAIIDTGMDYLHEDLIENSWSNIFEIPNNNIDDDNNGFIDDIFGYDFIGLGDSDPMDDNGHGTHCGGTIGAVGNNYIGVAGVCWNVKLMACKFLDDTGTGADSDAIECIDYARKMGADIINASWGGGGYNQGLKDAIDAAGDDDIIFCAAAGNSGTDNDASPHYPSNYDSDNIISVLATDDNDEIASFSCYGKVSVDIAAPGVQILSCKNGGGYVMHNGTSMATPAVAGGCALLKSINPGLNPTVLKSALIESVDQIPGLTNLCVSHGRMNIFETFKKFNCEWLKISPDKTNDILPGSSVQLDLNFIADYTFKPGKYNGELSLFSNAESNSLIQIPATMIVIADALEFSPDSVFSSSCVRAQSFVPATNFYTIKNNSSETVGWSLFKTSSWFSVSKSSGEIAAGATESIFFAIDNFANFLNADFYSENVVFSNHLSSAIKKLKVEFEVLPLEPMLIYHFPLDSDPGWSKEADWQFGTPKGNAGDPSFAHSGENVYGYNLDGVYSNEIPAYYLTTLPIDFFDYENVQLSFWRWLGVEAFEFDKAAIQVSKDGLNWIAVWENPTDSNGGEIKDTEWKKVTYDISGVADNQSNVFIRWAMGASDDSVSYFGWNIDDISFYANPSDNLLITPPTGLKISGEAGGPFVPSNKIYSLINAGENSLNWSVSKKENWLDLSIPYTGDLLPKASTNIEIKISSEATVGLNCGNFYDTIIISNNNSTTEFLLEVNLEIIPEPFIVFFFSFGFLILYRKLKY